MSKYKERKRLRVVILCSVSTEVDFHGFDLVNTARMKYAIITSVDVGTSSSMCKNILANYRLRFITDYLTKYKVVNFFLKLN